MQQFPVRKYRVWKPVGSRYKEKYITTTVKHTPSQIIWGAIFFMETGRLYFLPPGTTINGEKYVNLLKSKHELHMRVHNCEISMHVGAQCHRTKVVKKFLKQKRI